MSTPITSVLDRLFSESGAVNPPAGIPTSVNPPAANPPAANPTRAQVAPRVAISGNTYPVKDQLRLLGGRWNPVQKAWMVPADQAEMARKLVAGAAVAVPRARYTGSQNTKRCWECGRQFTYSDAKRNDGDWRDSYCGC